MRTASPLGTNAQWPLSHRENRREWRDMSHMTIAAILASLIILLLACGGPTSTNTPKPVATSIAVQAEPRSVGQALFIAKGCAACHGQNAEGSQIAPALPGHSEETVKRQVRNPRFQMPAFTEDQVTDEELQVIALYIASLSGEGHAHQVTIELTAAVEMHHWMALEALKVSDQAEAIHHVTHIIELLEPGQHRQQMVAILEALEQGETHDPEHDIEQMLAGTASPDLTLFQLHLRQALVALAVEDTDEAQHHVIHAQELADPGDEENLKDVSELMGQGVLHQAEHEIRELLGESERD